jgi:hypothetical protein
MNIQDAIKSGKPFRRKSDVKKYGDEWCGYPRSRAERQGVFLLDFSNMLHNKSIINDILATDWEIKV